MATLKQQLKDAKEEIEIITKANHSYQKVDAENKALKSEIEISKSNLKKVNQKLHDVQVITNAYIQTETTFKEVEVGNYKGNPSFESISTESESVKILRVILEATNEKATNSFRHSF